MGSTPDCLLSYVNTRGRELLNEVGRFRFVKHLCLSIDAWRMHEDEPGGLVTHIMIGKPLALHNNTGVPGSEIKDFGFNRKLHAARDHIVVFFRPPRPRPSLFDAWGYSDFRYGSASLLACCVINNC